MINESLAFIFPGQGSQKAGMLGELAGSYPLVRETFAEASEVLGYDLWDLAQNGQAEEINLTEKTQPLLLTASVAIWRIWETLDGPVPAMLAGHSLGEFSALVCAQSLAFRDAVKLVQLRGAYMQRAVPPGQGSMAAILGLDDERVKKLCAETQSSMANAQAVVEAVNFNSPGQVVIAGTTDAVAATAEKCQEAGARKAMLLPVSAPFHTRLMQPAGERLAMHLDDIEVRTPLIPVVHNVHARTETDPARIKSLLVEQIAAPVLWVDCVNTLYENGCDIMLECGPGKVLGGLNKRINRDINNLSADTPEAIQNAQSATLATAS